ncbi:hypothetical protein FEM48_Zijuj05G0025900 [Ziziphus jujuba var. spinosa]|uniref:FBD domain-containing protein n=1 Tax=Ziziphus jujuba var. spinosa TaxID=714518 RepID=A0A978VCB5_ZIZJJ|nr:hypothetical protein FEM48_Zijuj05G0025900 [Ziziphus jujuba var. spinosa]
MLHLIDVAFMDDELNITSSLLEDLAIEDVKGFLLGDIYIKVSAESLQYLPIVWNGDPRKHPVFGMETPESALYTHLHYMLQIFNSFLGVDGFPITLLKEISCLYGVLIYQYSLDEIPHVKKSLLKLFKRYPKFHPSVSLITVLRLLLIEIFLQGRLPLFHNVHSLTLIRTGLADEIPSRVALLNSTPHLNVLKIGLRRYGYSSYSLKQWFILRWRHNAQYWESQNLEFVHSVKKVEMEIKGKQDKMELIKYLLKNAKALEMMTIHYSSQ